MALSSVIRDEKEPCDEFWTGAFSSSSRDHCNYHLVVSFCTGDLQWLLGQLDSVNCILASVTVFTKCGAKPEFMPNFTKYIRLPNVGRCDNTYATYLATTDFSRFQDDEIIVFTKDENAVHQPAKLVSLQSILRGASSDALFSCGLLPVATKGFKYSGLSMWHARDVLGGFSLPVHTHNTYRRADGQPFVSKFDSQRAWLASVNISFTSNIVPVCYGGIFATRVSQVRKYSTTLWFSLAASVSRGDNIEESHFLERTWAYLFMETAHLQGRVAQLRHFQVIRNEYRGILGALYGCRGPR